MINVIIIEDEKIAADNLIRMLRLTKEPMTIAAVLDNVEDSITWFNSNQQPDLVFMDIHLKDGNSFSIFDKVSISAPIVFVTAYDNYLVNAFEQNSIEFLLKPINEVAILHTINKYKSLKQHFINRYGEVLPKYSAKTKRNRLIVKKGIEYQSVLMEDIAYFFTEHKVAFLVTRDEKKYLLDSNLKELEEELDSNMFYRANRKYIVNVNCIKSYKTFEKVKLVVELTVPMSEDIIVSQENATDFKTWMSEM